MKTAAIFALKVVVLTLVLIIALIFANNVSGMAHNSAAAKLLRLHPRNKSSRHNKQRRCYLPFWPIPS